MTFPGIGINEKAGGMKSGWLMLLLVLAATPCLGKERGDAQLDCDEVYGEGHENSILDLLDPDAPAERRSHVLDGYQRASSIAHCADYMYTLGQLYRNGPDLPGNVTQQDTVRAHELLLASAEAGYMDAYANLAEIALRGGDAREAMKWTQVYLYFVANVQKGSMDKENLQFYGAAYNGDLLARAERAWRSAQPKLDRKLIVADLSGYLSQHKTQVAARVHQQQAEASQALTEGPEDGPRVKIVGACAPSISNRVRGAVAVYIVEVLPSGKIGRVLPESFSPDAGILNALAQCARVYEFEPFAGEAPKPVRVPVMYGYKRGRHVPSFEL